MVVTRKRWGQHWLASAALAEALVADIDVRAGDRFVEIGPGTGRLTEPLLSRGARVTGVEIDPERAAELRERFAGSELEIIEGDVLDADEALPWAHAPLRLVGNLPYNVSGPILRWTAARRARLRDAHYMLQLEVAERVCAEPATSAYGLLSVRIQWEFDPRILRRLSPGAFRPPPQVDSAFIRLAPRAVEEAPVPTLHESALVEAGFAHRRKTLVNALGRAGHERARAQEALEELGMTPRARAEELSPAAWRELAALLSPEPV